MKISFSVRFMPSPARPLVSSFLLLGIFNAARAASDTDALPGDANRGKIFFQQNCAVCHATGSGPRNETVGGQGPSLVGVVGRRAASTPNFSYTKALSASGLTWTPAALDRFLTNPATAVPG